MFEKVFGMYEIIAHTPVIRGGWLISQTLRQNIAAGYNSMMGNC